MSQRDGEVSFNLNISGQDRGLEELTLNDLNGNDIEAFENRRGYMSLERGNMNIISKDRRHIQQSQQFKLTNFDTATFENSSEDELDEPNENSIKHNKGNKINKDQKCLFGSQESDFDLSETKLRGLGMGNSLRQEKQEYSKLLRSYSKQFKETTHLDSVATGRNLLDKYGYVLQREGSSSASYGLNRDSNSLTSFLTSHTPASFDNSSKEINERLQIIRDQMRVAFKETKDPLGSTDPYGLSIHSFQNSIFSGQKENDSYLPNTNPISNRSNYPTESTQKYQNRLDCLQENNHLQQNEWINSHQLADDQFEKHLPPREPLANRVSYGESGQSKLYPRGFFGSHMSNLSGLQLQQQSDDPLLGSVMQAHHLLPSGLHGSTMNQIAYENEQVPLQRNHPVHNMSKVFGSTVSMNAELKKRSISFTPNYQNNLEPTPFQKLMDAKKKYYDVFLPEKDKIMNNPLKLLKHRLQLRDKQTLTNCKNTLQFIDQEISNNILPQQTSSINQI